MRKIIAVLAMAVTLTSNADANDQATTSTSLEASVAPMLGL